VTELEYYLAFLQVLDASELLIERFTTLLFGFLIASYLVSAKLDRVMVVIVLSLFSVMAIRYAFLFYNMTGDIVSIANELRILAANPESDMFWLEIGPVHIFYYAVFVVMILSYAASLVFFFRTRRSPRGDSNKSLFS